MPIGDPVQHLVCQCNSTWMSILPPPPCRIHQPQAYNGLCQCRGPLDLHPFHSDTQTGWLTTTTSIQVEPPYTGKHRKD